MAELSVVIPTRDRRSVLLETLARLEQQRGARPFEVIVVDDGSQDGSPTAVHAFAEKSSLQLRLIVQSPAGPAAARNRGVATAQGAVVLFLGDDTWPRSDTLSRHAAYHRSRPELEAAVLGRVRWADAAQPTPFMRWLETGGVQFEYHNIPPEGSIGGRFFYTSNVSVKRRFLTSVGGFDETFQHAACEDIELGARLEKAGMMLIYDPEIVVDHFHPTDLRATLKRMQIVGRSSALLRMRLPERPSPRQPGLRHRLRAAALLALNAARIHPDPVRHATWRFLCHEAHREAFWDIEPPEGSVLRIGEQLLELAERDPGAQHPGNVTAARA